MDERDGARRETMRDHSVMRLMEMLARARAAATETTSADEHDRKWITQELELLVTDVTTAMAPPKKK